MKLSLAAAINLTHLIQDTDIKGEDQIEKAMSKVDLTAELRKLMQVENDKTGAHAKMFLISSIDQKLDLLEKLEKSGEDKKKIQKYRSQLLKEKKLLRIQRDALNRSNEIELPETLVSRLQEFGIALA